LKDIEKCKTAEEGFYVGCSSFLATRALYLTNAKKMHTPGSPGYSLNRLLFPPKNEQEKSRINGLD
jgi:singapore isolate B (sub-type 7) whole genome shotgun sequence assembly, scaffold_15